MRIKKLIKHVVLVVIATLVIGMGILSLVKFIVDYEEPEDVYYETELEAVKSVDNVDVIDTLFVFTDKDSITTLFSTENGVILATSKTKENKAKMMFHCISVRKFSNSDILRLCNSKKKIYSFINSRRLKKIAEELERNELYFFSKDEDLMINDKEPDKVVDLGDAFFYYYYDIDKSSENYNICK